MEFVIDEQKSLETLIKVLSTSGLDFRPVAGNQEGGFFYFENGIRKKFTENIFVKRLEKYGNK